MITAKKAKEIAYKSERMKEMLKEKHYTEVLGKIEQAIENNTRHGYTCVDLKTDFMYPHVSRIMMELEYNGYKVELCAKTSILSESLLISWK